MEKMVISAETISYSTKRHRTDRRQRLNPPLWHKRYRHLKELRKNVEHVIKDYVANGEKKRMADLGCGEMPYLPLLEDHLETLYAIDLPGNPRATHFVDLETNRTNLNDEQADIVWSIMVLEHVSDPQKYLNECNRLLKPGGKLILCTHGHWMFHPDPIDYWRWTCQGLRIEVEKSGFAVNKLWGMMGLLSMSMQLFQDAVLLHLPLTRYWGKPFAFVMQRFISLAVWFENLSKTTREYKNKEACVFFVVAEK
jgi:SAM-dependent methyltransferase